MESPRRRLPKLFRNPPKKLLEEKEDELNSYIRGPILPRPVVYALLAFFGISAMLAADWFGLLLLNREGVVGSIGVVNVLRVMSVFMAGIAIPSVLLMFQYRRLYSYVSGENVFFAITFSLSFILGLPCALIGIFG